MFSDQLLSNEKAIKLLAFGFDLYEDSFNDRLITLKNMQHTPLEKSEMQICDISDSVNYLKQVLIKSIENELVLFRDSKLSIGVTGGFDSRLIYGALNEIWDINQVYSFTFGYLGQFDYEFIKKYGHRFLRNHSFVNTNEIVWDEEKEVIRRQQDGQVGLYSAKPLMIEILLRKGLPDIVIHGFLGDSLSGSARPGDIVNEQITSWSDAVNYFSIRNDYFQFQELLKAHFDIKTLIPSERHYAIKDFDCYDVLDYGLRQYQRIKSNVLGDVTYLFPYENQAWQKATLSIGSSSDRELYYFKLMRDYFPNIFAELNDYDITNRKDFKDVIKKKINAESLKKTTTITSWFNKIIYPLNQGAHFCEWAEFNNNYTFKRFFLNMLNGLKQRKLLKNNLIEDLQKEFISDKKSVKQIARARLQGLVNLELNIRAGTIDI